MDKMSRSTQSTSVTGFTDDDLGINEITFPPQQEAATSIYEQQQLLLASINDIQRNLLNLNKPYLDCMAANTTVNGRTCKGKNDTRQGKKTKMGPIDTWNAHVLSNFIRDSVWPTNKILPEKWTHWVNDNRSLSQKVIAKVTIPQGLSPQQYWESMLVGMANEKFCALRSNIKQTLFLQYEGGSTAELSLLFVINLLCVVSKVIMLTIIFILSGHITLTADKKSGNDLVIGNELFTDVRKWPKQVSFTPSYDEAEQFLIFIDKYVKLVVGGHYIAKWMRMNRNKTLLDKLTASDIAYTILICENSKDVWDEELQIKSTSKSKDEVKKASRTAKPKYHKGRGQRFKRFEDGWTKEGVTYYKELCTIFQSLKNHVAWNQIIVHWHSYKKKHHETIYVPNEEFLNDNVDSPDEILHDEEWALEDEVEAVHTNEPQNDMNNHYDGENDDNHRDKRAETGGKTMFLA